MYNKKISAVLALLLTAILMLSACQQPASSGKKDTLIVLAQAEPSSVSTVDHNAVVGMYMNNLTHNGLFYVDENMVLHPDLVDTYKMLSDTEWEFKLKKGVKFHNGAELKAEDVKASLELCKESPAVAQFGVSTGKIDVIDKYTVKITTDGPQSGLLMDLSNHANFILPAELIKSGHDFNKEPIGTGPYKLVEWKIGENLEFEAFADYFKGEPAIKKIIWKIVPEGSSRSLALESGQADLVIDVASTDVDRLKSNSNLTVFEIPALSPQLMMMNCEAAPFNNQAFRRAVAAAIDKNAVMQVCESGGGVISDTILPQIYPGVVADGMPTYDVEKAKQYLAESGLSPEECEFSILCANDMRLRMNQVIQSNLKENLGIKINLVSVDVSTVLEKTSSGDFQAVSSGYAASSLLTYVQSRYHSDSINGSNVSRINVKEIDDLIDKLGRTMDPDEFAAVTTQLCKLINDYCPEVPLYTKLTRRAYNKKLQGFNCNGIGMTDFSKLSWGD